MTFRISCPRCNNLVDPDSRHCKHCGVDLALAAALAGHTFTSLAKLPTGALVTPEVLVPRLGDYLMEKKLLQPEDLERGLEFQRERITAGESCLIGQALVELGLINRADLDLAITEQILQLQKALQEVNEQLEKRVQERTSDLQRALSKLTELNQLKTNFISNISHELRTPLTHIKGYLDMLLDNTFGPLSHQQSEAVCTIQRSEARLENLIEDLIQFSLAARGELSIRLNDFSLDHLIDLTVSQSLSKAESNGISLEARLPQCQLQVQADEEKIGWVLMQLLDNAIKFTPRGGRVVVETNAEENLASVAVIDTGIGIPEDRISEIFEPFHQLDGSITRNYAGTGLGLTMVNRILNAHGLPIKVQSVLGRGSRFAFSLPLINHHDD